MPKITLRKENELMRALREEIVVNPMISLLHLQRNLQQRGFTAYSGNPLDAIYLSKLIRKLNRQSIQESDNVQIGERLGKTRERFSVIIDRLMKIAFWKPEYLREGIWAPESKDIVKALDTIQKMDLSFLQAELDCGIYERHLGKLDINVARKQPIPDDKRAEIWVTLQNWGMILKDDNPQIKNDNQRNAIEQPCRALMVIEQPA
jgi:hypothetical protein